MPLSDKVKTLLAQIRSNDASLTILDLSCTSVWDKFLTEEEVEAIANALTNNHTVTEVYLAWNKISDKSGTALAKALADHRTVRILDLNWNNIGDEGATAIANMLEINRSLECLKLSENQIGDNGAIAIAKSLEANPVLSSLYFKNKKVKLAGYTALVKMLKVNSKLLAIDYICYQALTQYGDELKDHLIQNLQENYTVVALDVLPLSVPNVFWHRGMVPEYVIREIPVFTRNITDDRKIIKLNRLLARNELLTGNFNRFRYGSQVTRLAGTLSFSTREAQPFYHAIKRGDINSIRQLAKCQRILTLYDTFSEIFLECAAFYGHVDILLWLLSNAIVNQDCYIEKSYKIELLMTAIEKSSQPRVEISIYKWGLCDADVVCIVEQLLSHKNCNLVNLSLTGDKLYDNAAKAINRLMRVCKTLEAVNLSGTRMNYQPWFGDSCVKILMDGLQSDNSLKTLTLCGCDLDDRNAEDIARALRNSDSSITQIDLSYNPKISEQARNRVGGLLQIPPIKRKQQAQLMGRFETVGVETPKQMLLVRDTLAEMDGINRVLDEYLRGYVHILGPELSSVSTWLDDDSKKAHEAHESLYNYGSRIAGYHDKDGEHHSNGFVNEDGGELKKPIVMIVNTQSAKAMSETDTNAQGGSHWVTCVILPKSYTILGETMQHPRVRVYYYDSLCIKKLPDAFKVMLTKGLIYKGAIAPSTKELKENLNVQPTNFEHKVPAAFPDAEFIEIDIKQQIGVKDCGWWAVYNAFMLVFKGTSQYAIRFKNPSPEHAYALRMIFPFLALDNAQHHKHAHQQADSRNKQAQLEKELKDLHESQVKITETTKQLQEALVKAKTDSSVSPEVRRQQEKSLEFLNKMQADIKELADMVNGKKKIKLERMLYMEQDPNLQDFYNQLNLKLEALFMGHKVGASGVVAINPKGGFTCAAEITEWGGKVAEAGNKPLEMLEHLEAGKREGSINQIFTTVLENNFFKTSLDQLLKIGTAFPVIGAVAGVFGSILSSISMKRQENLLMKLSKLGTFKDMMFVAEEVAFEITRRFETNLSQLKTLAQKNFEAAQNESISSKVMRTVFSAIKNGKSNILKAETFSDAQILADYVLMLIISALSKDIATGKTFDKKALVTMILNKIEESAKEIQVKMDEKKPEPSTKAQSNITGSSVRHNTSSHRYSTIAEAKAGLKSSDVSSDDSEEDDSDAPEYVKQFLERVKKRFINKIQEENVKRDLVIQRLVGRVQTLENEKKNNGQPEMGINKSKSASTTSVANLIAASSSLITSSSEGSNKDQVEDGFVVLDAGGNSLSHALSM